MRSSVFFEGFLCTVYSVQIHNRAPLLSLSLG